MKKDDVKRPVVTNEEYLKNAAEVVAQQAADNHGIGIEVDPDVAEYMGAFREHAISLEDIYLLDELETMNKAHPKD